MNIGLKLFVFFLKKSYIKKLESDKSLQSFGLLPNMTASRQTCAP